MDYDINRLSPEEKDQLLMQLIAKYDGGGENPAHPDEAQDEAMLEPFAKVLEILIDKVESLEERLAKNESLVIDDLFGGIQKMYDTNMRNKSIEEIKGKYGSMFEPHMGAIQELDPETDLYGSLHDMLAPLRGGEGWDDEQEMGHVKSVADAIAQKIAKIKGESSEKTDENPAGLSVEVTKTSAAPVEVGGADEKFLDKVRAMRAKAPKSL
jgi:hypothetical protein